MRKYLSMLCILLTINSLFADSGEELYNRCKICHGANGEKTYLNKVPALKDTDADSRLLYMREYKAGTLNDGKGFIGMGAVMTGQLYYLSDEDLKNINDYISTFK